MIIKRLRETRETLDIKQVELTEFFGVTKSTISGWETGKDTIPLTHLIKYANKYKLSLDYLFGLKNYNSYSEPINIDLNVIGDNLRRIRKANNYTQQDIADKINTGQSSYAHYENGLYIIPTSFIYNLSQIYDNFSIDEIFKKQS